MKRLIISITLLSVILIYSVSTLFIIKEKNKELAASVMDVQALYESNNIEAALEKLNNVTKMWDSYKKILLITVNSNKVNELNLSFSKLSPFIESNSRELEIEFQEIYYNLNNIYSIECPTWYNVF
jgi:hypothetical protein